MKTRLVQWVNCFLVYGLQLKEKKSPLMIVDIKVESPLTVVTFINRDVVKVLVVKNQQTGDEVGRNMMPVTQNCTYDL